MRRTCDFDRVINPNQKLLGVTKFTPRVIDHADSNGAIAISLISSPNEGVANLNIKFIFKKLKPCSKGKSTLLIKNKIIKKFNFIP